jgi:hypothetical protein
MAIQTPPMPHHAHAGVVFVDRWHALVARSDDAGPVVADLTRDLESPDEFVLRVAQQTEDCDRLVVMGPGDERLAFEREYVTLYHRPERLVDDEPIAAATRTDLLDRLRVLDS